MQKQDEARLSDFRIFETEEFSNRLNKLPQRDAELVARKLVSQVYPQLRSMPYFGRNIRKLRAYTPETWRYRLGRFRLFYTIDRNDKIVFILSIDDRKEAYR